jgi:hypothetical protein
MSILHKLLFILPFWVLASCTSLPNKNKGESIPKIKKVKDNHKQNTSSKITTPPKKIYTVKEILDRLEGSYIFTDNSSASFLKLDFVVKNNQLNYRLKTNTRNSAGLAKLSIDENGQIFILFPIEFDGYEGDLTSEDDKKYKSEKKQEISMLFDPEFYSIGFQNYGNAMNSYTVFNELSNEKFIELSKR